MELHRITDIYLASCLRSRGEKLVRYEKEAGYTVFFFPKSDTVDKCIEMYNRGEIIVNAVDVFSTYRELKKIKFRS